VLVRNIEEVITRKPRSYSENDVNTSPIVTNIYSYDGYSSLFELGWQELRWDIDS